MVLIHQIYTISVQLMSLNEKIMQKDKEVYQKLNIINSDFNLLNNIPVNSLRLCEEKVGDVEILYVCH